jgi:hypothetical protein
MPAGFCDEPAFGKPTESGRQRYSGYVPGLACYGHGGPEFRVFKDGDKYCAVQRDFEDLVQSPAGFGATPGEAIQALLREIGEQPKAEGGEAG